MPTTRRPWTASRAWAASCAPSSAPGSATCSRRGASFLADEQGLGKTVEALAALEEDGRLPRRWSSAPPALKLNWQREAARSGCPTARSTRDLQGTGVIADEPAPTSSILNYEIVAKPTPPGSRSSKPKALVLDESHYVKNPRAKRTQATRRLANALDERAASSSP